MALTADVALSTCCAELRKQLVAVNAPNTFNILRNFGLFNALESPQNMAGIDGGLKQAIESYWGNPNITDDEGVCSLKLWVDKPQCGTASAGAGNICTDSNTNSPNDDRVQVDVRIESAYHKAGTVEPSDVHCLCQGTIAETLNREIGKAAISILNSVELDLVTKALAAMGNYSNGTDSKVSPATINLLAASASRLEAQPVGWTVPLLEYQKMQTTGGILAVGGDHIFAYNQSLNLSPSLSPGGYVLPNGVNTWWDSNVQALVDETFTAPLLTWAPGALWIMRYLSNVNLAQNHIQSPGIERTTVNLFGQIFDLTLKYECEKIRWILSYQYDLYNLPDEVYGSCLDTNQRQAYNIGCDVMDCADLALPAGVA